MSNSMVRASVGTLSLLLALSVLLLAGCKSWAERGAKGLGTLSQASPNETHFSSYQPAHPYQQLTKGLLGRKLHVSPADAGVAVEINDFLVGPRQRSDSYKLPAPAIFEVRSGGGTLSLGSTTQQIETGAVVSVPAEQPFTIENQTDIPIAIRVEVLGSK